MDEVETSSRLRIPAAMTILGLFICDLLRLLTLVLCATSSVEGQTETPGCARRAHPLILAIAASVLDALAVRDGRRLRQVMI